MKTKLLAVEILCSLVCIAAAAFSQAEIKFTTLLVQSQSGHAQKKNYVIRSQAEWQKLWRQVQGEQFLRNRAGLDSALRKIDFSKQMIIAVFQGEKPTGGYGIAVNKLVRNAKQLEVFIEEKSPGPDCFTTQALTYPYHIIVTEASALKVVFTSKQSTTACR
jgi:hypothetical protein